MLFNSLSYAVFLPIVFILYWLLPHKARWLLLLASSYYFYMSWNAKYVFLILFTTVISYYAAILLEKAESQKNKKRILAGTAVACLGVLFFFKYFNFASESLAVVLRLFAIPMNPIFLNLLLPVGISFYTFQTLSYVIDVYKADVKAEHHFGYYAVFISFFPQLVAGPIERTGNLLPQIKEKREFDYSMAIYGFRQILWGLFKKIAVADVAAVYVNAAYADIRGCTVLDILAAVFFFTIQIYCDFSGYSDIAIGSARLLGIQLMQNFKSPYFACSIKDFWARWHISLSTWFRDYVYIPLGGNRCSKMRSSINLIITFLVSGLWHGANWTFVLWGGIHGTAQALEKYVSADKLKNRNRSGSGRKFVSWLLTFVFCNAAWVFFRADNIADAFRVFHQLLTNLTNTAFYVQSGIGLTKAKLLYIGLMILIVAVYDFASLKVDLIALIEQKPLPVRLAAEYFLLFLIVYALFTGSTSNQFVYFQF